MITGLTVVKQRLAYCLCATFCFPVTEEIGVCAVNSILLANSLEAFVMTVVSDSA